MNECLNRETFELINQAKTGNGEALSCLIEKNIGLVWSIVKRFYNRGYEEEDLFQIGCIGLIKAIKKFDMSFDVMLSTYAVPMIIGEIKRFIRDDGIIKVSRSLKEMSQKIRVAKEKLSFELGRDASLSELSEYLNIQMDEIIMAQEACLEPESLHSMVGEDNNTLLIDMIYDKSNNHEGEIIDKIVVKQILDSLDTRERQIIILRYYKQKTQMQIAKLLGISQVQVSRIEKNILKEIRKRINYN